MQPLLSSAIIGLIAGALGFYLGVGTGFSVLIYIASGSLSLLLLAIFRFFYPRPPRVKETEVKRSP